MLDVTRPKQSSPLPKVLVTGFDPFGGATVNPSWEAVHALHGATVAGHGVIGAEIPTIYHRSLEVLRELIREHKPRLVICTGQAGGRSALSLERIAINVNDARIPDNAGAKPIDTPVIPGAPDAYFTKLPIKAMLAALLEAGVNAEVSQTAGTFVCNHVFFGLMHEIATNPACSQMRGGMIHVPYLPQQGQPSMRVAEIVDGLRICIDVALRTHKDICVEAGALS